MILGARTSSRACPDKSIVCTDKLAAYNTLGQRLQVQGFTPFQPPNDYKPYDK